MADEKKSFGSFFGDKPHDLIKIVKLKPEFTTGMLTDGLASIYPPKDPNAPPYVDPNTYHRFQVFLQLGVSKDQKEFFIENVKSEETIYFERDEAKELYLALKQYFDADEPTP